jgi:glycosyltransferase involved in cell wall biosynthesis
MPAATEDGRHRRLVVVSTFPPRRDGIARYAAQLAAEEGTRRPVLRFGLPGSEADVVANLNGHLRPLRLLLHTRAQDELLLMWHPEFYVAGPARSRVVAYLALGAALRFRRAGMVIHEPDGPEPPPSGILRRLLAAVERLARGWLWSSHARLVFHSERERRDFAGRYPSTTRPGRTALVEHGRDFTAATTLTKSVARAQLGLPADWTIFVCLGFIARHKGFDRALEAFATLPPGVARLHIVGSTLYDSADERAHLEELRARARAVPGSEVLEGYVDDATFDLWTIAADAVVLPYRAIASSSVLARAHLLGVPVIAAAVGALPEQLGPGDTLFSDDGELAEAMARATGATASH